MDSAVRASWANLDRCRDELRAVTLRKLFAADNRRFQTFSCSFPSTEQRGLLLDFSKCLIDVPTKIALGQLAQAAGVAALRDRMFAGEAINVTEKRAVLHVALRNRSQRRAVVAGHDVMGDVRAMLGLLGTFADEVRTGTVKGATGAAFSDIVNIGIGGSDLGPAMATAALKPFHDGPAVHFVSNVDGAHLAYTLAKLDPARTLFIIASKTFTTIETMTNARSARAWIMERLGVAAVKDHFVAVSTALEKVEQFGIREDRVFGFWDWVGGRYSVWSSIGLALMIAIGPRRFAEFLDGGHAMDEHFRSTPFDDNLPMLLGMIGVWHRSVCGYPTRAVIPYAQRLALLPAFLQQLEMESNGKRVDMAGRPVEREVGAVVWGAAGTDAQHSFFQMLHQGQETMPVEFIAAARGDEPELEHHHRLLVANCLAQSEALALGRSQDEALSSLVAQGLDEVDARRLAPHKTFPGNRPSLTILLDRLDPFSLGQLIALYEHRVFVEAAVHGINAFDQWGVELGKELAAELAPMVAGQADAGQRNASTRGLISVIKSWADDN